MARGLQETSNGGGVDISINQKHTTNGTAPIQKSKVKSVYEVPPRNDTHWTTWLILIPIITLLPYYLYKLHYYLPEPLPPYDAQGKPQPSEQDVLAHIGALENAGYRVVGTEEALEGERYVLSQVRKMEEQCNSGNILNCEVWVQKGSGHHSFTIMDHDVLKMYKGVTNIILRISAKNPPTGKRIEKDAILLGSHIDSTLPAPGAADDGMGVGVMLDIARVLVDRNEPFDGSIIFLWNGAEETLQDGSHLYSTQHETAKNVRAVINLEAAGTTGGELLFQATSAEMIEAYSHVPHPRGSVIAADVFASGIMISDTDFVQFQEYLGVSGLDMAIVGHSYFYHTRRDSIVNIEKGSSQHFANNIIAVVDHLLSPNSSLLSEHEWSPPDIVYIALFDRIWVTWSMVTATKAYTALAAAVVALTVPTMMGRWKAFAVALIGAPTGLIMGFVAANVLAFFLVAIGQSQTWFRHEHLSLITFVPFSLFGMLGTQYAVSRLLSPVGRVHLEDAYYYAQLAYSTLYMLLLQSFKVRSAYVFAMITIVLTVGVVGQQIAALGSKSWRRIPVVWGYAIPLSGFVAFAVEAVTTTLDIFTPLTGRTGKEAPAENIVATISAACAIVFLPVISPLFHRLSRRNQRNALAALALTTTVTTIFFCGPWWSTYDFMHPKRMGMQYTYNHTSGDHVMQIGFMDRGTEGTMVEEIFERYGDPEGKIEHTSLTKYDADWDILYPVSSFMDTYKFPIKHVDFDWPDLKWTVKESFHGNSRKLNLTVDMHGLVWPTLAFDAEVEDWHFEFKPPQGKERHHLKIATSADDTIVEIELTVKGDEPIKIFWSAVDGNQLVPHTAARKGAHMPAGKMFLDMDKWADDKWKGTVDIIMGGVVTGVIEI